jgi:hypothetical protein
MLWTLRARAAEALTAAMRAAEHRAHRTWRHRTQGRATDGSLRLPATYRAPSSQSLRRRHRLLHFSALDPFNAVQTAR